MTLELSPIPVTLDTFTQEVKRHPLRVTVAFLLAGDGPSLHIRGELDQLAMLGRVATVDGAKEKDLCAGYGITEFPSVLLMDRGVVKHKFSGYQTTASFLRRALAKNLAR